jgi:prepilin-type N-terminal cleavage/methylation domain-containing protein
VLKNKSNKGFTVVELLTVMGIVGVLMAVALPGILSWIPEQRLKGAARELHDNLQFARIYAIKAGQDCYLDFNEPATGQYTLSLNAKVLKTADLSKHSNTLRFDSPPERIIFQSNGISRANTTAVVRVTNNIKAYLATVYASGAVKLEKQ